MEPDPRLKGWLAIQATAHGVTNTSTLADIASGGWIVVIRPPKGVEPARTLAFARKEVGVKYGFLTIASIVIDTLTPRWFHFPFRRPGTWICSALGAESLRFGGWFHDWDDIYQVDPAEVMWALLESGGTAVTFDDIQSGDVGFSHTAGLVDSAIRYDQHLRHQSDWEVNHMFIVDKRISV